MDIEKQAVREYLLEGYSYRALAEKYGVSRSTINKWVLVYQGIHNIPRSHKQASYDPYGKKPWVKNRKSLPCHRRTNRKKRLSCWKSNSSGKSSNRRHSTP